MVLNLKLSDLLDFLQQHETSSPNLQMMCPVFGEPLPSITIGLDSLDGYNAKIELSLRMSEALMKNMLGSRAATVEVSN